MENKIDWYLKKYGTVENLLENGNVEEKDDFFLKRRLLEVGYDDNPLGAQHALDAFLRIASLGSDNFKYDDANPYFSIFSLVTFEGETNLFYPPGYLAEFFPEKFKFNSVNQFFKFHSALLFLDRNLGCKLLSDNEDDKLSLNQNIENFDGNVWKKYRVLIMEEGAKCLFATNAHFREQLIKTSNMLMAYSSRLPFWGMGKDALEENYWGKILTRIKLESSPQKTVR